MSAAIDPSQRYARNIPAIMPDEQRALSAKRVCVCGCGGLGGYVVEYLARVGVGAIVVVDGDAFEASNLNRQLLCREGNLGQPKAAAAKERAASINSDVDVVVHDQRITAENASEILKGCDVVVDALDSLETRFALEHWCATANVPLVHGAISGWYAQVTTIAPGSGALEKVYPDDQSRPSGEKPASLSFTPALAAAIEASECVKVLLDRGDILYDKLVLVDLLSNTWRVVDLD